MMASEETMRVVIDWGTTRGKVAVWFGAEGTYTTATDPPQVVIFASSAGSRTSFPMVAGYFGEEKEFRWGEPLYTALKKGDVAKEEVIEVAKLSLYPDYKSAALSKRVEDRLAAAGRTKTEFIADHLNAIWEATLTFVKKRWPKKDVNSMAKEVQMSVPLIWNPGSNKIMSEAAELAGLPKTELILEPIAAAACILDLVTAGNSALLPLSEQAEGRQIQIMDVGGGTVDIITCRVTKASATGATMALEVIGEASGGLCGSYFINEEFLKWIENATEINNAGGLDKAAYSVNLSVESFLAKASQAFEEVKVKGAYDDIETLRVGRTTIKFVFGVPSTAIESFFQPVIADVVAEAVKHFVPGTEHIFVTGRFGDSLILHDAMCAQFGETMIIDSLNRTGQALEAVVLGAMMRYSGIINRSLPTIYSFGIQRVEKASSRLHRDAFYFKGDRDEHDGQFYAKTSPNYAIVKKDAYIEDLEIVEGRWSSLLTKGTVTDRDPYTSEFIWVQYILPAGEIQLSETIYWTEGDVKDHEAVYSDIDAYDQTKTVTFDPASHNFTIRYDQDGQMQYEVFSRMRLTSSGPNTQIEWQLVDNAGKPINKSGHPKTNLKKAKVDASNIISEHSFVLRSEDRNPFPHDAVVSRPPTQSQAAQSASAPQTNHMPASPPYDIGMSDAVVAEDRKYAIVLPRGRKRTQRGVEVQDDRERKATRKKKNKPKPLENMGVDE